MGSGQAEILRHGQKHAPTLLSVEHHGDVLVTRALGHSRAEANGAPAGRDKSLRQKSATMPKTNGASAGNRKPQQELAGQESPTKAQLNRPAVQEKDQHPQQQDRAEQRSATGASLPALLLSTAHAVLLSASHSFTSALPVAAHAFRGTYAFPAQQPSKEDGDAERQFLDTARGPAGDYRNAHRVGQGNCVLPAGVKPHVWVSFLSFLCAHTLTEVGM